MVVEPLASLKGKLTQTTQTKILSSSYVIRTAPSRGESRQSSKLMLKMKMRMKPMTLVMNLEERNRRKRNWAIIDP